MVYTHVFVGYLNTMDVGAIASHSWRHTNLLFFLDLFDINLHPYLLKFLCNFPGVDSLLQDLRRHRFVESRVKFV